MRYYDFLNESFDKMLQEAKQDDINFANVFGQELLDRFKALKQNNRLSGQESDNYFWIRKSKEDLEGTIAELDTRLSELEHKVSRAERRRMAQTGAEVLYEDDEWIVLKINTYEAAQLYGAGSVWCITGRYHGHEEEGQHWFDNYRENNGWDYYFYIKKDGRDLEGRQEKWCLCWDGDEDSRYEIWKGDQREQHESEVSYIPDAPQVPGLPDVSQPQEYDDEAEEPEDWDDEQDEEGEPAPREPEAFELVDVENPNELEFPARSKEEAAKAFKEDAEIVVSDVAPNLHIVKWHEEPLPVADGEEQTDMGDRFSMFVFLPGQGGGPLLTQTSHGFALQVFKDLDKIQEFANRMFRGEGGPEIRNNREDTEDMPECLKENFYYYNDNSWFYDL